MAQELERSPEGRQIVSPGPDGLKRVNIPMLSTATAAGVGRLTDRIDELEQRLRAAEARHIAGVA